MLSWAGQPAAPRGTASAASGASVMLLLRVDGLGMAARIRTAASTSAFPAREIRPGPCAARLRPDRASSLRFQSGNYCRCVHLFCRVRDAGPFRQKRQCRSLPSANSSSGFAPLSFAGPGPGWAAWECRPASVTPASTARPSRWQLFSRMPSPKSGRGEPCRRVGKARLGWAGSGSSGSLAIGSGAGRTGPF